MNKKERLVAAIENGTVIDHIPAEKTHQVASLLGLFDTRNQVTIGINFVSNKVGRKGIIKVSNRFFTDDETRLAARVCCIGTTVRSNLFGEDEEHLARLVNECASRANYALVREHIEPGTKEAFDAYVTCLRQLYLFGMAVQLKRMGYHMERIR